MAPITTARRTTLQDALDGGAEGVRTPDLLNAIQALYQLSYDPVQSVGNVRWRLSDCQNLIPRQGLVVGDPGGWIRLDSVGLSWTFVNAAGKGRESRPGCSIGLPGVVLPVSP